MPPSVLFFKQMPRWQKIILSGVMAVALYSLLGFVILPLILKPVLTNKLSEALGRNTEIAKVRLNPYTLSATVEGFHLSHKGDSTRFIAFDRLHVNLESLSLFKKALILRSISLSNPAVDFSRLPDNTFSFSDLLTEQKPDDPPQAKRDKRPFLFSINNIEIDSGTIRYRDIPKDTVHQIGDLRLAIPSISNLPSNIESFVEPVFSAVVNGTPVTFAGGSKLFAESRATDIDLKMEGINIPEYLAYVPNPTTLRLKSALLDLDTRLSYLDRADGSSRLALTGTLTLRELEVTDQEDKTYLRLPATTVVLADSDLLAGDIHLARIDVDSPYFELIQSSEGKLLPLSLLPAGEKNTGSPPSPGEDTSEENNGPPAWALTVDDFRLRNGEVLFRDHSLKESIALGASAVTLEARGLSTLPRTEGSLTFALDLNKHSKINGEGTLSLTPFALKTKVDVASVQLADFQPYVTEYSHVLVADGSLALQGDLVFDQEGQLRFTGASAINRLSTKDDIQGEDLLTWNALRINGIALELTPFKLDVAEIRLDSPTMNLVVREDGSINLASLARSDGPTTSAKEKVLNAEEEAAAAAPELRIDRVVLSKGLARVHDRSISPSYGLTIDQLQGEITGISSEPAALAQFRFDARIDQQAPLIVSGTMNPLAPLPQLDLAIDFKNFNLSPLSPYSGKYVGHKTEKGKLNLDLHYDIRGSQLESDNRVFLDQFTLGERVESPDATSLPVNLAIALLKNRQGEISLDIPVRGDLSDPEFSVGGVVLQVLVNLMTKAATSPFALLGSLIPEGEDLQYIPFEPGETSLGMAALDKLPLVANVLLERPGLKMDLAGQVDLVMDSRALAKKQLLKRIKLEKLKSTRVNTSKPDEDIPLSEEEYAFYLERIYRQALQSLPQDAQKVQTPSSLPEPAETLEQRESFLLDTMKISDEDLRLLAIGRANSTLEHLTGVGQVDSERLFVIEPQISSVDESKMNGQAVVKLLIK
ncbi:DUF748 domain-containing protein [Desulfuromonas sp. AOP6]|uniref:DUF748 domain-containing protein n=1 Tax=Desulfuromonas sp. AOP6 TaxID=1566351 RepID=UPI00127DDA51|nr:DUF748 domain-containing protein [Desulfuromonas sp. AOP6]BCA79407.1 hypothetical protein AOP6_1194 [Desulfuromonas sp. AOP6]